MSKITRRLTAGALALAATAGTTGYLAGTAGANGDYPQPRPAQCRAANPRTVHDMGATGDQWLYVDKGEAEYFHISRCSIVLDFGKTGSGEIITPRGRVVTRS